MLSFFSLLLTASSIVLTYFFYEAKDFSMGLAIGTALSAGLGVFVCNEKYKKSGESKWLYTAASVNGLVVVLMVFGWMKSFW